MKRPAHASRRKTTQRHASRPVVHRLPTARRASAPHRPSCIGSPPPVVHRTPRPVVHRTPRPVVPGSPPPVVPRSPSPVMCNDLASRRPVICHAPAQRSACSRRRQPLCREHIFACTPWRFMNARSAARLRRIVGRSKNSRHCFKAAHCIARCAISKDEANLWYTISSKG